LRESYALSDYQSGAAKKNTANSSLQGRVMNTIGTGKTKNVSVLRDRQRDKDRQTESSRKSSRESSRERESSRKREFEKEREREKDREKQRENEKKQGTHLVIPTLR
jgi:hypothetical protein